MKTGDIILVKAKYDPLAWLIRLFTGSNYNHVGIIIDNKYLLEAKAVLVRYTPIRFYKSLRYEFKVIRYYLSKPEIKDIIKHTKYFLDHKRSYLNFIINLIKVALRIPNVDVTCCNFITVPLILIGCYNLKKNVFYTTPKDLLKIPHKDVTNEYRQY